jgi:hypothetical protein
MPRLGNGCVFWAFGVNIGDAGTNTEWGDAASQPARKGGSNMLEELVRNEEALAVAAVAAAGIIAIVVFGCGWVVVSIVKVLSNARIKRVMIDRGMSADEIERVVQAGLEGFPRGRERPAAPAVRKPKPSWNS